MHIDRLRKIHLAQSVVLTLLGIGLFANIIRHVLILKIKVDSLPHENTYFTSFTMKVNV